MPRSTPRSSPSDQIQYHAILSFRRLILCFLALLTAGAPAAESDRPNILLIMADDVGIEGLGCYGGTSYRTPHLDRMASEGLRFTQAYSQPLCTPTRVQLMTGKYNHRNWKYFGILDPKEKTFGHLMQDAGYATGIFGKWQLQSYDPPDLPGSASRRGTGMHAKDAGFDEYALFHALHTEDKGSRYTGPTMLEGTAGSEGEVKTYSGKYGEDIWVDKIVNFFDKHRDEPTFVYYPMALPHWPFEPTPNTPGWNPQIKQPEEYQYITDMIEYMDTTVGSLTTKLAEKDLLKDTIVIFYSDNGTHVKVVSKMNDGRSIQGGKATTKQTGIHVPLIGHWPGHIPVGVTDRIVDASDFLPTLVELAGSSVPEDLATDGISFAPRLFGKEKESEQRKTAFFWYDSRPGWDKERFSRHVFALNHDYKLFRNGRLFRLTNRPLEEIEVDPFQMSPADKAAKAELTHVIANQLATSEEPPLINAYGEREHDLLYLPKDKDETQQVTKEMLQTGKEIVYGDASDPKDVAAEHRMWIFNPLDLQEDELRPLVFFIHGGGWGGRPESLAAQAVYLQRQGFNTASIHFRAPKGDLTPRDTLKDARAAYRWIVQHGKEHHIDVDNIVVSGGSAGGHLSLALSTIVLEDDPVIQHMPKGYVLFNPVIDLVDGWAGGRKKCEAKSIDPKTLSPAHHVVPGLPPTLILSGSEDGLIPPKLIHQFQKRMADAGNQCEFIEYQGAGHGFFNYGREDNRFFHPTMWKFEQFLESVF